MLAAETAAFEARQREIERAMSAVFAADEAIGVRSDRRDAAVSKAHQAADTAIGKARATLDAALSKAEEAYAGEVAALTSRRAEAVRDLLAAGKSAAEITALTGLSLTDVREAKTIGDTVGPAEVAGAA